MTRLDPVHERLVLDRRVRVLAGHLAPLLPRDAQVLDIGSGDGLLAATLALMRPDVQIVGIDTLVRPDAHVPVTSFDGRTIPFSDGAVAAAMLVDVIHHADDGERLLGEALRVAGNCVLVKDHLRDGLLAERTLRFMDHVGNARHGVSLPYRYWSTPEWMAVLGRLGARSATWNTHLGLYPWPASMVFDRSLHFVATLERT